MRTLLLDQDRWDLVLNAHGDIAVADPPYALAQDAASAIKTFQGEVWYNKTVGVPYFQQILGRFPPLALMKAEYVAAALTVPTVVAAICYISDFKNRQLVGQVQLTDTDGVITTVSIG